MSTRIRLAAIVFWVALAAGSIAAQAPRGHANTPEAPAVSPAQIHRMFDAYALVQAQDQLKINDEQFAKFLPRYKALQDVRRTSLQQRARIIQEMRRLVAGEQLDDAQLKERLTALAEVETHASTEIRKAYEAIDQILEVPQQVKFRIFEEQMDRRKLELVTRARQANRARTEQPR